jgi:hypothetical protein
MTMVRLLDWQLLIECLMADWQAGKGGKVMIGRISIVILALVVTLVILAGCQRTNLQSNQSNQSNSSFNGFDLVDKAGNISKPADYRDRYPVLGTWAVKDLNGETELHYTWASPGAAEYYRKNGKFADGTVLVKEVTATGHGQMTTGDVNWATGTKVWFLMVKDEKGRFPGNPLWGNGWGWALYHSDAPDKQIATDFKKDCIGCHIPAKATDWIYIQGYPVLASSK